MTVKYATLLAPLLPLPELHEDHSFSQIKTLPTIPLFILIYSLSFKEIKCD